MALNFINFGINTGMIGLTAAQLAQKPEQTELFTNVHITIGMGPDPEKDDFRTAGNTPTVAIFDKFGNRVGQSKNTEHIGGYHKKYDAGKAKKVWVKEKEVITLRIKNEQMEHQGQVDPAYLFLAALETDAPCIAAVSASGNGVVWNWFGDIAAQCPGIQWYASNKMVGDGVLQAEMCLARPRFLQGTSRPLKRGRNNTSTRPTHSAKRMTFWHDVQPDFYLPAGLKLFPGDYDVKGYNADMTDKDFKQVIDNKAQFGPSKAGRKLRGDNNNDNNSTSSVGHGHLVISDHEDHSAKELCESSSSLGPDFVSTGEGIFCDMNQKEYWFLCNADIKTGCFDLKKKEMVGATPGIATRDLETGRIIPEKRYNTHSRWKPDVVRVRRTKMGPWRRWVMDIVSPLQAN